MNTFIPDGVSLKEAFQRTRYLGIGAHADDLEIFAFHGILQGLKSKTPSFGGITVTDGRGSPRAGKFASKTDDEMVNIRKEEQTAAAKLGKYSFQVQLGIPSQKVKGLNKEVSEGLFEILNELQLDTVYLHNLADKHDTHVATSVLSLEAIRKLPAEKRPKKVYGCEVWRSLDWMSDDQKVALDVTGERELGKKLCQVFQSQIAGGKSYDLAAVSRRISNATFFESHTVDQAQDIIFAMDLTELVHNSRVCYEDFLFQKTKDFQDDVMSRLRKYLPK